MNCFDKTFSIQGDCSDFTPSSGLYINNIGIDLSLIDSFATSNYPTGFELFKAQREFAGIQLASEIVQRANQAFKGLSIIDNSQAGYLQDGKIIAASGKFTGVVLELCKNKSPMKLNLNKFIIETVTNQDVTVYVVDLIRNKIIDQFEVTTNTPIYIDKNYGGLNNGFKLGFVYLNTQGSANTLPKHGYCSSCSGGFQNVLIDRIVKCGAIEANSAGGVANQTYKNITTTGGMQLEYNLECDYTAFVCSLQSAAALPHMYLTAALIMRFGKDIAPFSRVNTAVTLNLEAIEENYNKYMAAYEQSMNNLLANMKYPQDSDCFICKENVRYEPVYM
jgi:hypothetical protein